MATTPDELLTRAGPRPLPPPAHDALAGPDALEDAQLLEVRFRPVTMAVGLLFDLRQAPWPGPANAAVLVVRGAGGWSGSGRRSPLVTTSPGASGSRGRVSVPGGTRSSLGWRGAPSFAWKARAGSSTRSGTSAWSRLLRTHVDDDPPAVEAALPAWGAQVLRLAGCSTGQG